MAMQELEKKRERAVLAGLAAASMTPAERATEESMEELAALADTAGADAVAIVLQTRQSPDPRSFLGEGKVKEIHELVEAQECDLVIVDNELSPSQSRALEEGLGVRVLDRSGLILDIFAQRARTREGRLQVELAQYNYLLPRLTGMWTHLKRQAGTSAPIGTRGPGETQLETDRRHIRRRIQKLEEELEQVRRVRATQRRRREKTAMPVAALVGYTNAGKSTLLNNLTDAGILAEDKLFATLDPTTRRLTLPSGNEILLTDTVGFIDRLPTHLVKAFRSTLEELKYADFIISVTDASEDITERERKRAVTSSLVAELGASDKPMIEVYNKCDAALRDVPFPAGAIEISAKNGDNIEKLLEKLDELNSDGKKILKLLVPHKDGAILNDIYRLATVLSTDYVAEGTLVEAECDARAQGKFKDFIIK